ncbi:MAG: hypothetical protein HQL71_09765 [Magnetococcales bacterium]|nr:hypothetical protein [Magnetococcales bacterium]
MAISDLASIQGLRLDVGKASPQVLNAVKSKANKHVQTQKQLTAQSSSKTSGYTKGFANKAYSIELTPSDTRYGPTYSKPK